MRTAYTFVRKGGLRPALALFIAASLLASVAGFVTLMRNAQAAALLDYSDTLSDSDLSASSAHTLRLTTTNSFSSGQTMVLTFDPGVGNQRFVFSDNITTSNLIVTGMLLQTCSGTAGEVNVSFDTSADTITFAACSGDTISAGTITVNTATSSIARPSA